MHHKINQILAAIATGSPTDRADGLVRDLVVSLDAPEELVYRIVREGLAGIFYRRLKKSGGLELLAPDLAGRLAQTYYHAVQTGLRLESELARVLEKMTVLDLQAVVLQGASLQSDLYPEPGLRPMEDIDVWVRPTDFPAFGKLLRNSGYVPDRFYPGTFRGHGAVLDIHTHLFWADRIQARRHLLTVGQEVLFEAAEQFEVCGQPAIRLSRYDQVLYLGLHLLKHNVERLIWLVDIRRILERLKPDEWGHLIRRADFIGQTRTLAQVLFLMDELLPVEFPDMVRRFRNANRLAVLEKWVLRHKKRKGRLPGWSTLVLFPPGMRRGRWRLIWETFFPKLDVMQQIFPEAANLPAWRLYVKRVFQLAAAPLRKGV